MKKVNKCKLCGKETNNPKFCSKSHAASYNNIKIGARHGNPKKYICECGAKKNPKAKRCHNCNIKRLIELKAEKTINDMLYGEFNTPSPYRYTYIRDNAKRMMKYWNIKYECRECGYNLHVNVCHIKSINSFSLDTKLKVVNSKENLIYLCPNHHWEMDNNLLKI